MRKKKEERERKGAKCNGSAMKGDSKSEQKKKASNAIDH